MTRRQFLNAAAGITGRVIPLQLNAQRPSSHRGSIRAIAFDGFVVFDPRSVAARVEEVIPGKGAEFTNLWRTRQFEYSWLRTAGQRYVDFWHITDDALTFTAESMKLPLSPSQRERLMDIYRTLPPWPDAAEALAELRRRGIRLAFLSNFTAAMLDANLAGAKLRGFFEEHLTTDRVQAYKPSPRAYQMAIDAFGLGREEIAFAAFGPWDAAGAKWFGYPTVWVNRTHIPPENLGARPDLMTSDLSGLLEFCR